jgi:hypothetical protein
MVAPGFDEFAVLRIFDDAVVGLRYRKIAVAVGEKMSPFGATRTSDGLLNSSGPLPATSGLPSVISRWPSGANCVTVWFLPSVTQTVPSGAANSPCGHLNKPEPKLTTKRPDCVEFLNRRDVRAFAGFSAAAIEDPKTGAVAIDVDADCLPPDSSVRKLRPVLDDMVRVKSAVGILSLNPPPARRNARKYGHGGRKPKHCSRVVTHGILPSLSPARLRRRSHWR